MEMAKSTEKRIEIIKIVVFTGVYESNPYNTECTSLRGQVIIKMKLQMKQIEEAQYHTFIRDPSSDFLFASSIIAPLLVVFVSEHAIGNPFRLPTNLRIPAIRGHHYRICTSDSHS